MKIGFAIENGSITAMLTGARNLKDYQHYLDDEGGGAIAVSFLDLYSISGSDRGGCDDAFEAIEKLALVNPGPDSICYALEYMLEQVFIAGQEYARRRLKT